jgi:site-specific DNA-methyltransferase (adenine-specific)
VNRDWNVIQGDARDVLPTLSGGSRDVCIADPPYGDTSLEWDSRVSGWIAEVARILKPNASIWVFGSMRFLAPLFAEMAAHGFKYSQDIVWEKQNGTGFHNDRFRRVHEHAVLFYRGAWADVYHDTQYTMDATAKTVRRKTRPTHTGHNGAAHYVSEDGGPRLMRSVLQVRNEHGKAVHPTQKPIDLLLPLVRYSVPPGGSVLDPFMGSGSTGVACVQLGAKFTGVEDKPEYVEIARARISHEYAKGLL